MAPPPQEGGTPRIIYAQMGWRMHLQCVIWSRVCGEVGLVGQQINQVLRRFSNDSNHDRKLDEMDRGDSHFYSKAKLKRMENHASSFRHSAILLLTICRENDPR